MSGKLRVLISALLLTPAAALGLGLGEIRLNSALNQPLSAEIDLVAATPEELAALDANLASSEIFARYGLDRPAFLNSLEFTVGRGQDDLSPYTLLFPVYWLMMSMAAYFAIYELIVKPHYWQKTEHGLHAEEAAGASETPAGSEDFGRVA